LPFGWEPAARTLEGSAVAAKPAIALEDQVKAGNKLFEGLTRSAIYGQINSPPADSTSCLRE